MPRDDARRRESPARASALGLAQVDGPTTTLEPLNVSRLHALIPCRVAPRAADPTAADIGGACWIFLERFLPVAPIDLGRRRISYATLEA